MTATKPTAKKTAAKKGISLEIIKQRRETVEQRIAKLEIKLGKDRELLTRYTEEAEKLAAKPIESGEDTASEDAADTTPCVAAPEESNRA